MKINAPPTAQETDRKTKRNSLKGRDLAALKASANAAQSVPTLRAIVAALVDAVEELRALANLA